MGVLSWIVVGLIAGWLADRFIRGPRLGIIGVTILGVVGGMVGGFLATTLLKLPDPITGINLPTIITAFLGSAALLLAFRFTRGRRI
jgi:uncharacterized membrane protein YeaQ/YmgE (transglycosylase-associated protein family)